jgi:histidinol-phosphate aminotransferase
MGEARLAQAQLSRLSAVPDANAVLINANENPLGPSVAARTGAIARVSEGGRYQPSLAEGLARIFAEQHGLKPEYVDVYPGSGAPLHYSILAFTGPARSYVCADPTYEAGSFAAKTSGARMIAIPVIKKTYAHDLAAMVAADPKAGLIYVCTPNNPTGTVTSHDQIEWALKNRPAGSILLVDEAYIHFCGANSVIDLVRGDQDLIVLRTFSKIYGMAGLRCGLAIGRPDLLKKVRGFGGWSSMPITAVGAGIASLQEPNLVAERKQINSTTRSQVFEWLTKNNYSFIPSEANFFLLDTRRPGHLVMDAMAKQNVFIGRVWPIFPTCVRITVGTPEEMARFREAFAKTMDQPPNSAATLGSSSPGSDFPDEIYHRFLA